MNILNKIKRYIFGYDVFISYSRKDGLVYSLGLAEKLLALKYECYLDQITSTKPGPQLPDNIKRAIQNSSAFVLIGSDGAQNSPYIHDEIKLFLENNNNCPFIPITFDDSINNKAIWFDDINGLAFTPDNIDNLLKGEPSSDVIGRIVKSLNFKTKNQKLRRASYFVFIITLVLGALSLYFFFNLQTSLEKLEISKNQTIIEELKRNFNESDFTTVYDKSSEILLNLNNSSLNLYCDTSIFTREFLAYKTMKGLSYNFYRYDLFSIPIEGNIDIFMLDDGMVKVIDEINVETFYKYSVESNYWEEFSGSVSEQKSGKDTLEYKPIQIRKNIYIQSLRDSTLFYVGYSDYEIEKFAFNDNYIAGAYSYNKQGILESKVNVWKIPIVFNLNAQDQLFINRNSVKSFTPCKEIEIPYYLFEINNCPKVIFFNDSEQWENELQNRNDPNEGDCHEISHPSNRFNIVFCNNKLDVIDFANKSNLNLALRNPIVTLEIDSMTLDKNFNYALLHHKGKNNYQRVLFFNN